MSFVISITQEDIVRQVKLSRQLPEILFEIVNEKILNSNAEELGIEISISELQQEADAFRFMNGLNTASETWRWLEEHFLSVEELEKIAHQNVLAFKLADKLFSQQVEPYFFAHQLDYTKVVMYQITLDDPDLALELYYAIKEGETSFYDVAHKYISDPELRRKGGYQGIQYRQDLHPEIAAAVFAHPPQLLSPIATAEGVHLVLVEEILQAELDGKLRWQILSELLAEWNKQKREQIAVINNFDRDLSSQDCRC